MQLLTTTMLRALGYDLVGVSRVVMAWQVLEEQQFDLLFTDVTLGGGEDGITFATAVHRQFPQMKILLTSGFSLISAQELIDLGAVYLSKPYRKRELDTLLSTLLSVHPAVT